MPCTVTAFSVKIASPGDAAPELIIAREVVASWNALHALKQKRILLPVSATEDDAPADLLVEFFRDIPGASSDEAADTEEVERQLAKGRPVHIYVSEGRVDFSGPHVLDSRALEDFRTSHPDATVDSYGDEKEFRAKFARQLEATVSTHAHFKLSSCSSSHLAPASAGASGAVFHQPAPCETKELSACAQIILVEACDDFEGYIGHLHAGTTLRIQANGKQLVEGNDPATHTKWECAFNELLTGGYIRPAGHNLFQISERGYEYLKTLGKTPVGYIAELGGM